MKVALIGNPNSGKSTLFNKLTGMNQKIGNWPGVTIEKKIGKIKNTNIEIIDLPGIYSLNPYTQEEKVTSDFILQENVNTVINIIDCNSIERGLFLTAQLMNLNLNVIVALNMYEKAREKGFIINENNLSNELQGISVIKISAITGHGISELIQKIIDDNKKYDKKQNAYWHKNDEKNEINKKEKSFYKNETEIENIYKWIDNLCERVIKKEKIKEKTLTEKIDRIILNKFVAFPIFILIMFAMYFISINIVGNFTSDGINKYLELLVENIKVFMEKKEVAQPLINLITNGILNGLIAIISFLPQLIVLFIIISFLEKVGYMSRISLLWDKVFRKLGMSGNSIISFILGTGCSVPGIMSAQTNKNEKERKTVAILTPFIPCSAKLPIISLFTSYFFKEDKVLVVLSFYLLSIIVIIFSSLVFQKNINNEINFSYISELPEYHLPKFKYIIKDSFEKTFNFIKRSGSIVLISSIVMWILLSYSFNGKFVVEIENSMLADLGKIFSYLFVPMVGENSWELTISAIQGLFAKEQVISSMVIIAGFENKVNSQELFKLGSLYDFFSPVSAYAYVCFNLFCAPCFGGISAMRKILGGTKNTLKAIGYQFCVAYVLSCTIYGIGNYFLS